MTGPPQSFACNAIASAVCNRPLAGMQRRHTRLFGFHDTPGSTVAANRMDRVCSRGITVHRSAARSLKRHPTKLAGVYSRASFHHIALSLYFADEGQGRTDSLCLDGIQRRTTADSTMSLPHLENVRLYKMEFMWRGQSNFDPDLVGINSPPLKCRECVGTARTISESTKVARRAWDVTPGARTHWGWPGRPRIPVAGTSTFKR